VENPNNTHPGACVPQLKRLGAWISTLFWCSWHVSLSTKQVIFKR
jgi:hypothetical protein